MLTKIAAVLIGALVLFAGFVALQPSHYEVSRSTQIAVPPDGVFAQINDFHHWKDWSPWAKLDPAMQEVYSGPASGPGAMYHWISKSDEVGEGKMTILDSNPGRVAIRIDFIQPFASTANVDFQIAPAGEGTGVKWTMAGEMGFVEKAVCLFMGGMDGMIGPDFEKGLAQLKAVAEKG